MRETKDFEILRGDIYFVDFGKSRGSVIRGKRPAIVIQNDMGNKHSPTLIVAAITSGDRKKNLPTHLYVEDRFGLTKKSIVLLEHIQTIDKSCATEFVGHIDDKKFMRAVDEALEISIGLRKPKKKLRKKNPPQNKAS